MGLPVSREEDLMSLVILMGRPGSGKGTFCDVAQHHGYTVISSSMAIETFGDEEAKRLKRNADPVPDYMMRQIIHNALHSINRHDKVILDGFPRTVGQVYDLLQNNNFKSGMIYLIHLSIGKERAKERVLGRGRSDDSDSNFEKRNRHYCEETIPAMIALKRKNQVEYHEISTNGTREHNNKMFELKISELTTGLRIASFSGAVEATA